MFLKNLVYSRSFSYLNLLHLQFWTVLYKLLQWETPATINWENPKSGTGRIWNGRYRGKCFNVFSSFDFLTKQKTFPWEISFHWRFFLMSAKNYFFTPSLLVSWEIIFIFSKYSFWNVRDKKKSDVEKKSWTINLKEIYLMLNFNPSWRILFPHCHFSGNQFNISTTRSSVIW